MVVLVMLVWVVVSVIGAEGVRIICRRQVTGATRTTANRAPATVPDADPVAVAA